MWKPIGAKYPVFEWDEDFNNGSHYHVMDISWGGKHLDSIHYEAGMLVPEPWVSAYFD
ncbi:hypothetical protein [Clostridium sp. HBUAS56017]|uniref:hypothetical protein n=1 Tax=Clostridium sp. HBUAS56017 TaxID=2571128 RepID=UPI00163DBF7B|nr:hypothetical protein [Clostridium sp. HBUAS56017]